MSKWNRVVVSLELQVPFHNKKVFDSFLGFLIHYEPDRLVGIGDAADCPAPARWNRGTAEEYAGKLQQEINTLTGMFSDIRNVFDGQFDIHEGNHERRINVYAKTKAPAFVSLDCLSVGSLLKYQEFNINELPAVAPLCPGWVTTHDLGGQLRGTSKYSGGTAMGIARRLGKSVVMGHTHKLGHIQEVVGGRRLHGVETGHMMDVKKANYISYPNWQSGWAVVEYKDDKVHAQLVNVEQNGKVHFNGY